VCRDLATGWTTGLPEEAVMEFSSPHHHIQTSSGALPVGTGGSFPRG